MGKGGWGIPEDTVQGGPSDAVVGLVCRGGVQFVADGQTDAPVGESMSNAEKNSPCFRSLGP